MKKVLVVEDNKMMGILVSKRLQQEALYEVVWLQTMQETVDLLDRAGEVCGPGKVTRVRNTKAQDRTPMVTIEMERGLVMNTRFFRRRVNAG